MIFCNRTSINFRILLNVKHLNKFWMKNEMKKNEKNEMKILKITHFYPDTHQKKIPNYSPDLVFSWWTPTGSPWTLWNWPASADLQTAAPAPNSPRIPCRCLCLPALPRLCSWRFPWSVPDAPVFCPLCRPSCWTLECEPPGDWHVLRTPRILPWTAPEQTEIKEEIDFGFQIFLKKI